MSALTVTRTKRRAVLAAGALLLVRPAFALPPTLAEALAGYSGGKAISIGRVHLDIATLVENGNTVPVTLSVDSPMSATDHVVGIALFNERNPQREIGKFTLGPRAGRASISTRIRLATSQKLTAVAHLSDGSYWSHTVEIVVALAACIETPE
jgi:sulfur-oxidizing protein SoxY